MLDKNSKKIVRALESDARMSFAALGDEIGMSKTPAGTRFSNCKILGLFKVTVPNLTRKPWASPYGP
ncbi:AsnC family protein [Paraglaciecola sp. Hal342]